MSMIRFQTSTQHKPERKRCVSRTTFSKLPPVEMSRATSSSFPALDCEALVGWHKYTGVRKSSRAFGTNSTCHIESFQARQAASLAFSIFETAIECHVYILYVCKMPESNHLQKQREPANNQLWPNQTQQVLLLAESILHLYILQPEINVKCGQDSTFEGSSGNMWSSTAGSSAVLVERIC